MYKVFIMSFWFHSRNHYTIKRHTSCYLSTKFVKLSANHLTSPLSLQRCESIFFLSDDASINLVFTVFLCKETNDKPLLWVTCFLLVLFCTLLWVVSLSAINQLFYLIQRLLWTSGPPPPHKNKKLAHGACLAFLK